MSTGNDRARNNAGPVAEGDGTIGSDIAQHSQHGVTKEVYSAEESGAKS